VTVACDWLTAKEAAKVARVTPASIWRWIRKGWLTYHLTPSGRIRICKKDLMEEVKDHAGD